VCRQQLAHDGVTGGTRLRCFVPTPVACERRADPPIHFLHRCDINHVGVLDDLTRVLKFMRYERKDLIVAHAMHVGRDEDPDISVHLSRSNERQHAAVETTEGTNTSFHVDDSVGMVDVVNERSERDRPLGPFFDELQHLAIRRSHVRRDVGRRGRWPAERAHERGREDEKLDGETASFGRKPATR